MSLKTILSDPKAIRLEYIKSGNEKITLIVSAALTKANCPQCSNASGRIHSRYKRKVADLPWQGVEVQLQLHTRRFFCQQDGCAQRIFCERLPGVVAHYARRSVRLNDALTLLGFALGGEAGARTAEQLNLNVSHDTLLRRVRQAATVQQPTPRVLGIDDFAFRRGRKYGTILVDLERRAVIDLLTDREAGTLANWLKEHPGVEFIARDRSGAYAEGARNGAPEAKQIVDRWHLLKNLGETVERFLTNHNQYIQQATLMVNNSGLDKQILTSQTNQLSMLSSSSNQQREKHRQKRFAKYCEVVGLHKRGMTVLGIARKLKMSRMTVYKYVQAEVFPERASSARRKESPLNKYIPYIHRRMAEGCDNIQQLRRELAEQGYKGKGPMVRRYVERLREKLSGCTGTQERLKILSMTRVNFKTPSSKRVMWWLIGKYDELKDDEKLFLQHLNQIYPTTTRMQELAQEFQNIVKRKAPEELDKWLDKVNESNISELKGFADALKKERQEILAALTYPWSTSPVEGHINKLKMIKRQMFGRANFDLLKARVINF